MTTEITQCANGMVRIDINSHNRCAAFYKTSHNTLIEFVDGHSLIWEDGGLVVDDKDIYHYGNWFEVATLAEPVKKHLQSLLEPRLYREENMFQFNF